MGEGRSLAETPTWSVATVTSVLVGICFIFERSIHHFGEWLVRTKRKPLLAALNKIKDELMLLGFISLLLTLSSRWISGICVKSSVYSSRFYPCTNEDYDKDKKPLQNFTSVSHIYIQHHTSHFAYGRRRLDAFNYCSKGHEPFVSYESLEQLHRFLFVLGATHVFYSCLTMLLALIKIYSWRPWEIEAHAKLIVPDGTRRNLAFRRQSTFVLHHTSHPWSKNRVLIWVLCFLRQFYKSVKKADYTALRLGFITNHRLRLTYDFHCYMVRTMEDEFRDIVGISWLLWGYAIFCICFNLHGWNFYFWISFIPELMILFVGTKLQHVMAKLALDNEKADPAGGIQLKPRDELFWFGKPELLLWFIQFISFQNAFEMATFVWSWWEIKAHTCFMKDHALVYIRLISGLIVQFWCSYGILPLYAIVTQMGSRYKKALISEEIRVSLHGWRKRVRERTKRESLHPSSTAKMAIVSSETVDGDKDEASGNEVSASSLSLSQSSVTRRSTSLPRELSTTYQTEICGEDCILQQEALQQQEALGSQVSKYSSRSSNNTFSIELDIVDDKIIIDDEHDDDNTDDDDSDDDDEADNHLLDCNEVA